MRFIKEYRGEILIISIIGFIVFAFLLYRHVTKPISKWNQIEIAKGEQKIDKPVKIIIQRNGRWYIGSELDVLNNQK